MGFADALEQQLAAAAFFGTSRGEEVIANIYDDVAAVQGDANFARSMRHWLHGTLLAADTYAVAPHICDLLTAAADSYPVTTLRADMLPSPEGFVWLARPLPLPQAPEIYEEVEAELLAEDPTLPPTNPEDRLVPPVAAVLWARVGKADHLVHLTVFAIIPPHAMPCVVWTTTVAFGESWDRYGGERGGATFSRVLCYLFSLWEFMAQGVLVTGDAAIQNRGARRRIARQIDRVPVVKVVALRRRLPGDATHEADGTPVEWSCQWLVRGHWRNQPYKSTGEVRPIWIMPYTKGPSDKPLKRYTGTAFEVRR